MMSSSGNRAASTMACNLSAAAESVNSGRLFGGFGSVVGGGEGRGFEQGQQIGRPGERETHRLKGAAVGRCHAQPADAVEKLRRRIAHICMAAINRIAGGQGGPRPFARPPWHDPGGGGREALG